MDVLVAKLMNIRQQGKPANTYAKEIEDLTKKLETAYINDGLPNMIAATYATNSAVKAIIKNASNDRVKLIMESGTFNNLNEVIAKFISSCTEAYGQPNSILTFQQGIEHRNRGRVFRGTNNRNRNFNNNNNHNNGNSNINNNRYNYNQRGNNNRNRGYGNYRNNPSHSRNINNNINYTTEQTSEN